MSDCSTLESIEPDEYCPICQVPFKSLKIEFSLHVNMCDVRWNELEGNNFSVFNHISYDAILMAIIFQNVSTE